jgi:hypothetical protein
MLKSNPQGSALFKEVDTVEEMLYSVLKRAFNA